MRLTQVTPHTRCLRGCQHIGAPFQTDAIVQSGSRIHRLTGVGLGQGGQLFNHYFRLNATDDRFDRIGIKDIRDRRLYALFC
jgi:hypothetical protein